jgi:hypothetical protein
VALLALAREGLVDLALRAADERDHDLRVAREIVERELAPRRERVIGAHRDEATHLEELSRADACWQRRHRSEGEVERAGLDVCEGVGGIDRQDDDARARRLRVDRREHRGREHTERRVHAADREGARGGARLERAAAEGRAEIDQRLGDRRGELLAALGGHEALLAAHEELVAEHLAEARERAARGGLGEAQAAACAGHAALGVERVEGDEQVEIERREIRHRRAPRRARWSRRPRSCPRSRAGAHGG